MVIYTTPIIGETMDSLMVLIAGGLVVQKYISDKRSTVLRGSDENTVMIEELPEAPEERAPRGLDVSSADIPDTRDVVLPLTSTENPPVTNVPVLGNVLAHTETLGTGGPPDTAFASARPPTVHLPRFAENDFHRADESTNPYFNEQFFPQDTKNIAPSVTSKPWMRAMENAYNKPREETVADFPTKADRDDANGISLNIPKKVREFEMHQAARTVPVSSEKQHELPVEALNFTGGGERRGFHPVNRYHKFLLSDNELIDAPEAPRGNFAGGAGKSSRASNLDNTRGELDVYHTGVPTSSFFRADGPEPSFELDPSNAESWELVEHIMVGQRGPVDKTSNGIAHSFVVAHDENLDTFETKANSNLAKSVKGMNKTKDLEREAMSTTKDAEIATPSVVGAMGGTRLSAVSKSVEVDPKHYTETLSLGSSKIAFNTGSAAKNKNSIVKSFHTDSEETFAEKESGRSRKGSSRSKAVDITGEMVLNDNRADINATPFTSENLVAPKNANLPAHLRVAPTASITAFDKDIVLKGETEGARVREMHESRRTNVVTKTTKETPKAESTVEDRRLSTVLSDRMNMARQGVAPKMPANPYVLVNKIAK